MTEIVVTTVTGSKAVAQADWSPSNSIENHILAPTPSPVTDLMILEWSRTWGPKQLLHLFLAATSSSRSDDVTPFACLRVCGSPYFYIC